MSPPAAMVKAFELMTPVVAMPAFCKLPVGVNMPPKGVPLVTVTVLLFNVGVAVIRVTEPLVLVDTPAVVIPAVVIDVPEVAPAIINTEPFAPLVAEPEVAAVVIVD